MYQGTHATYEKAQVVSEKAQSAFSAFSLHLICSKLNDGKTI
jgi:hypothetical protein